ncbi:flagellar motor switch phosphatase FliY [Evansella sp. AB-rgal1]|uniref:flagellar motor switch phosphatase FliY n=1 Tax=Evansella sp. AB-rgal1 TaxID=3242696 RepID=UPI00359CDE4D
MSDMLSQEEINALLNGMNNESNEDKTNLDVNNYLSSIEQDALGEIGNISFGSSATALSTLLNNKVDITTPEVSVVSKNGLENNFPSPHVVISVKYTDGFEGTNLLVINTIDAAIIADIMLGNDGTNVTEELTEMEISAVQEAMNQMMGSASTSMSTIFNKRVDISPPGIDLMDFTETPYHDDILEGEDVLVQISFHLKVGTLVDSKLMQLIPVSFAKDMVEQLMNPVEEEPPEEQNIPSQYQEEVRSTQEVAQQYSSMEHTPDTRQQPNISLQQRKQPERSANVQPVAFGTFDTPNLTDTEVKNLDMLLDIQLEVTVELGRTKRSIKDILELGQGSIIELDKLAGEPVDILVNQRLIAKGEVVVIDENFGVRLTDIVSQKERLHQLK